MKDAIIAARNNISRFVYQLLFKPVFFNFDPESVHDRICGFGEFLGKFRVTRLKVRLLFYYSNKKLEQEILGIKFENPIGLAAGFDKNARLTDILPNVGFGFCEVGSITGDPCEGNPKPRLWRLKKSKGLVVWYGLTNEGSVKIAKRLKGKKFNFPLGTNIAKTNSIKTVSDKAGIEDYVKAFSEFTSIGDYFTINISCPNAYGGQPFTEPGRLDKLLSQIDKIPTTKPIFLKLSPDLAKKQLEDILKVVEKHRIDGFICTNLTENRNNKKIVDKGLPEHGGISGKVVEELSNDAISYIYKKTKGKYLIIGLGGVFSAEDAYKKIKAGASLVQLITGMIFVGPQLISDINMGLVSLLQKDGYSNISQAIGVDNK